MKFIIDNCRHSIRRTLLPFYSSLSPFKKLGLKTELLHSRSYIYMKAQYSLIPVLGRVLSLCICILRSGLKWNFLASSTKSRQWWETFTIAYQWNNKGQFIIQKEVLLLIFRATYQYTSILFLIMSCIKGDLGKHKWFTK